MKRPCLNRYLIGLATLTALQYSEGASAARNIAYQDSQVRFTVIADGTVRMEWQPDGVFLDGPSLLAVNRDYPEVKYKISDKGGTIVIETSKFKLVYKKDSGRFTCDNLKVSVAGNGHLWYPGDKQKGNLKGTTRTLDGLDGDEQTQTWCADMKIGERRNLDDGLLATDGWTLIDDSANYTFDGSQDWSWVADRKSASGQDWYLMTYGHDFKSALNEYTLFAGKIPLPPRFAFGYWWSRYWAYSDKELQNLVDKFDSYDIPLDVLVVDMDWHYTDEGRGGWTGWTWNKSLFPNPSKFISKLHDKDIKVTVNLHPADGFESYEEVYPELARKLGRTDGSKIQWINSDKSMMTAAFETVFHPMEKNGIDFWWLDWQQAINDPVKTNLNNTWWINYCFFSDMERNGEKRPLLYHRWGGLGNHRYQVGFSGDAVISWKSLDYQPYFTATASNVLYGYWSHDIGGHLSLGEGIDPEMYTRWLQFGAVSPIMRTHSCKNSSLNKEPWVFSDEYRDVIRQTIQQRYKMVPYIYAMARKAHETGISLCRPMYYDYPEAEEAYKYDRQYMFGDNMLIAPVTSASVDGYTDVKVWLPEGKWFEYHTGTILDGGKEYMRRFAIDEYGIYVKAGSVIPMYDTSVRRLNNNDEKIVMTIFPGADGNFNVYEDAGNDKSYEAEYAVTPVSSKQFSDGLEIIIGSRKGSYKDMPEKRNVAVKLLCVNTPLSVTVDGQKSEWKYSGDDLALIVELGETDCAQNHKIEVRYPDNKLNLTDGLTGQVHRVAKAVDFIKFNGCDTHGDELASLGSMAEAASYSPENLTEIVRKFRENYSDMPNVLKRQGMNENVADRFLKKIGWQTESRQYNKANIR